MTFWRNCNADLEHNCVNAIITASGLGVPLDPKAAWDECESSRTASLTSFDIRLMLSDKTARRGQGKAVGCAVPTALLFEWLPLRTLCSRDYSSEEVIA